MFCVLRSIDCWPRCEERAWRSRKGEVERSNGLIYEMFAIELDLFNPNIKNELFLYFYPRSTEMKRFLYLF
jgi:hypothetical protein